MLRIDNVKHLFVVVLQTFQNDEVVLRLLYSDDVDDLVFVGDLEREVLLANLAVDLVKAQHLLSLVHLFGALCLKPVA